LEKETCPVEVLARFMLKRKNFGKGAEMLNLFYLDECGDAH
jgi:hypothetical protein